MCRLRALAVCFLLAACGPATAGSAPNSASPPRTAAASPSVTIGPAAVDEQDATPGPGGMTLRQEIGAVMMVGFHGPPAAAVLNDWRQRQFGGLLIVPANENAQDPSAIRELIQQVRAVMVHPVLVASDLEGGTMCFAATRIACLAAARQSGADGPGAVQSEMTAMAQGLKALGFDINFAPVADVWDGVQPGMRERSYGQNGRRVAEDVAAAIAGIHAAGMYAVAEHFPGEGTAVSGSPLRLPTVSESVDALRSRDWIPFRAAIAAHVDFVMVGHLDVPALDNAAPTSMSAAVIDILRHELGYQGLVISDDLQVPALTRQYAPPTAAVRFLEGGGDMVIISNDIGVADATYDAIHAAVVRGAYPRARLDASVQKLLSLGLRYMP